ncbi:piggyBac transposable element-derived protein 3-like [Schistocerca piceifrons]|uniref:piggyBac transposable element-derived protein 3-like n=1 Tax=Schistocerca piceifrons TaxID=274613 RepID=UPI001F5F204F|nr:piggyBac transposable element-derived protein 3-like [Schistocerca piceifrons]
MDARVRLSILQIFSNSYEDDDVELAIIPPNADVITDEENIDENVVINESVVQDVPGTLELITSRDEANTTVVPPEAKRRKALGGGAESVFNSISRNRFWEIKRFIHLNDNSKIDRNDKMYKLRLYFEMLKKEFGKFGIHHSELSIDEMMVCYYGKHSAKMFLRRKPIKFGYKICCLTSFNGFLYNFSPYCGKTDNKQEP